MTPTYADANGSHTYYEASGDGEPLVLLHGGFGGTHVFGAQVTALAERYRVLVPEQRGRGRTADVTGPISYQVLALMAARCGPRRRREASCSDFGLAPDRWYNFSNGAGPGRPESLDLPPR